MFIDNKYSLQCMYLLLTFLVFPFSNAVMALDDGLDKRQSVLLDSVISTFHIEHCCQASLKSCIKNKKNTCPIAEHLYEFSLWLVQHDNDRSKILEQLEKRYTGFITTKQHVIDTLQLQWAGSPAALVRITAYISSTCNLCKYIVGEILDSITDGTLSGKVKLMVIPFGTGIGDIALFAANSEGKFWELFKAMRENKARYKEDDVIRMGKGAGIAEKRLRNLLKKPEFRKMLMNARAEGSKNGVKVTPTFFINEKRYSSYKDPEWIIDAALFEFEKKRKTR